MFLSLDLGNIRVQHGHEQQNSDKSPGPTLPIKRSSKRCANRTKHCALALRDCFERASMANQRDLAPQQRI